MLPKSLSATSASVFEGCPARYKAENIDRTPRITTVFADLGKAVHGALELFVAGGYYKHPDLDVLLNLYREEYEKLFTDDSKFDEGVEMLKRWFGRTDLLDGRQILSTEKKSTFTLKTSAGPLPFTYIFDRADYYPERKSITVVDYKTFIRPVKPEELRHKIQPRAYALAVAIEYKHLDPEYIWVDYDLLRYENVGLRFSREDNIATWRYLQSLAERIIADDGTTERLNPECKWCVRAAVCKTLLEHAAGGGILGISTLEEAIDRRAQAEYARTALNGVIRDLDEMILEEMEQKGLLEVKTDLTEATIEVKGRRAIDSERAAQILPPEFMARYGKLNVTAIDALLKDDSLDATTKAQLKQLITKQMGNPTVATKPLSPHEDS